MSQPQATTVARSAGPREAATIKPLLNSSLRELEAFTHPATNAPSTPDYPDFDRYWSEAGRIHYVSQSGDPQLGTPIQGLAIVMAASQEACTDQTYCHSRSPTGAECSKAFQGVMSASGRSRKPAGNSESSTKKALGAKRSA